MYVYTEILTSARLTSFDSPIIWRHRRGLRSNECQSLSLITSRSPAELLPDSTKSVRGMKIMFEHQVTPAVPPSGALTQSARERMFDSVDITSVIRKHVSRRQARKASIATNLTGHEGWGPNVHVALDDVLRFLSASGSDDVGEDVSRFHLVWYPIPQTLTI